MRNVTEVFDHYRVSVRSIWNTAFWPDPELRQLDLVEQWETIDRTLFLILILVKLDVDFAIEDIFRKSIPFFHVTPNASVPVPIMIAGADWTHGHRYWNDPIDRVTAGKIEMHFLGFFDWDNLDYRDLHYYHVRIAAFPDQPHLVGRQALIERMYVDVILCEEDVESEPSAPDLAI